MSRTLVQPQLWASLQFGDKDAFTDFLGGHWLWHVALDQLLRAAGAAPYPTLSLGDGPVGNDAGDWHLVHQAMHVGEAAGLALSAPPDFTGYDLNHQDDFATWTWTHAAEHQRLWVAAGL